MNKKYHLFEVYGIELEYMLVSTIDLKVVPAVDLLLTLKNGELTSDIENGTIAWSNELVAHVVELKTNGPTQSTDGLSNDFHNNIREINQLLKAHNMMLLPTAS
ncbi:MAG: glutamate--cysteine ligase, partial [Psychroserpens sp.]|nr:glutamate--cysteine ligase [Psychroserpens sp.]